MTNNIFKKIKNGQALPLNTIVIAMLVIIVLLVIIVFFTSSVSKSGATIDENSASSCSISNPAIKTLGYKSADWSPSSVSKNKLGCEGNNVEISFIPDKKKKDGDGFLYKTCCGTK